VSQALLSVAMKCQARHSASGLLDSGDGPGTIEAQVHFFGAAAFVGETAEGVFEDAVHLAGGRGEGGVDVGGFAGCYQGSTVLGPDFEHAAFFDWAAVRGAVVFAGEVYIDAREVGFETLEDVVDVRADGV
jgi:hypothetical protein